MPVERWHPFRVERISPFRDLQDMQGQMNRLFDDFFGTRVASGAPLMDRVWAPAVDIYETREDLVVVAELPGVQEKDIRLSIVENMLSLKGQRAPSTEAKEENYHRIERWTGPFERHIQLPLPVQPDKVRASYREGVLEIRLPKVEEVKAREIKIEVG
jgi:HSP20 family protein